MFIIAEDRTTIINMDNVNAIYSCDSGQLRAEMREGRIASWRLATYISKEYSDAAMDEIIHRMCFSHDTMIKTPTSEEVEARLKTISPRIDRAHDGKKPIRRGGS